MASIKEIEKGGIVYDIKDETARAGLTSKADSNHNHDNSYSASGHSHSYNDLSNKPTIPTVDVTKSYVDTELAKKSDDNHTHSDYASNTHNHDTSYSQLNHTHNYATETYVTNAIANAALGGDVNLDGYATETYVDTQLSTKSDSTHNHDGSYATTTHTHTGYATESYVTDLETSVDTEISQLKSTMDDFVRNKIEDILNRLMLLEKSLSVNVLSTKYLNSNWKFNIVSSTSSSSYTSTSESAITYDDSGWSTVNIPHDWSIYNNFSSSSASGYEGGYLDGGDAWYRYDLDIDSTMVGKDILLYFDGVYMECDIYVNGTKVKTNKFGYNPFYCDITEQIDFESENIIAVFVRNMQPSSRWYSGSGIYRNVILCVCEKTDVSIVDTQITYSDLETEYLGDVVTSCNVTLKNSSTSDITLSICSEIYNKSTNLIVGHLTESVTVEASSERLKCINVNVNKPNLWDIYTPNLYYAKIIITYNGASYYKLYDFGYRFVKFTTSGFYINGVLTKLKGVCMHHDLGCIGAEVNVSAIKRQIDILKKMGVNAIRITHNPASSEYLNECMNSGILVVEELFDCWTVGKKTYDFGRYFTTYGESITKDTISRGKNNPSIIMWSIGNEIIRTSTSVSSSTNVQIATNIISWIKSQDTTRPITIGDDTPTNTTSISIFSLVDVVGVNYNTSSIPTAKTSSGKPIYGSETTSAISSRGIYSRDDTNLQCSSFDDDKVTWGDYAYSALKSHFETYSYSCGMFVWTGFDYIGEPAPFNKYPSRSSYFGIIDTCGFPKDIYYMYQSRWTDIPMIHILPHWNWTVGSTKTVWLYSNCNSVELFLNGTSLGSKLQSNIGSKYQFEYSITYVKGTLVANGYDSNGSLIAQDVIYTSQDEASTMKIKSDKLTINKNSDDYVFIECDIVDENGVFCPTENISVTFSVTGGSIVGTDNGNPTSVENMRVGTKTSFNGKVLCVIKNDGTDNNIVVKATSSNLSDSNTVTIQKSNSTIYNVDGLKTFCDASSPTIYSYGTVVEPTKTLTSISATKTTTEYETGSTLSTSDIIVTGTYSDNSTENLTSIATFNTSSVIMSTVGNYSIGISVTVESVTKTSSISISVISGSSSSDGIIQWNGESTIDTSLFDYSDMTLSYNETEGQYILYGNKSSAYCNLLNTSGVLGTFEIVMRVLDHTQPTVGSWYFGMSLCLKEGYRSCIYINSSTYDNGGGGLRTVRKEFQKTIVQDLATDESWVKLKFITNPSCLTSIADTNQLYIGNSDVYDIQNIENTEGDYHRLWSINSNFQIKSIKFTPFPSAE